MARDKNKVDERENTGKRGMMNRETSRRREKGKRQRNVESREEKREKMERKNNTSRGIRKRGGIKTQIGRRETTDDGENQERKVK